VRARSGVSTRAAEGARYAQPLPPLPLPAAALQHAPPPLPPQHALLPSDGVRSRTNVLACATARAVSPDAAAWCVRARTHARAAAAQDLARLQNAPPAPAPARRNTPPHDAAAAKDAARPTRDAPCVARSQLTRRPPRCLLTRRSNILRTLLHAEPRATAHHAPRGRAGVRLRGRRGGHDAAASAAARSRTQARKALARRRAPPRPPSPPAAASLRGPAPFRLNVRCACSCLHCASCVAHVIPCCLAGEQRRTARAPPLLPRRGRRATTPRAQRSCVCAPRAQAACAAR
jgi:hypothetical protein